MSLYIGIDSGTQSTKLTVIDLDARQVIAEARAAHTFVAGLPPGHVEQHPPEWIAALDALLIQTVANINAARVRAIGVSAQQHGFVPLDVRGNVIRPAKLWCDTSTAGECDMLTRKLGGRKAVIARIGLPFLPGYTAPKILWLKRNEPAHFRRLRHVLLPHDYLNHYLTGTYCMERGDASGTALLDVRRRLWSREVCRAIDHDLADFLPPLIASHSAAGTLRPDLATRYGLSPEVIVSAGGGDNMMAAIGTGNVEPGIVTASLGTSGTVYAYSQTPVIDRAGEIAAFCDSTGGFLPLACTQNVTLVTDQFRALFGWDHAAFDEAVARVPPGADGLRLTPHLDGERTPDLPRTSGTLAGITRRNLTPAHLARAAVEGVTHGLNYGLKRLRALGIKPNEIRLTGGAARSGVWRQVAADIFGVPVVKLVNDECAALGAALQAAWCVRHREGRTTPITDVIHASGVARLDESTRCVPQ